MAANGQPDIAQPPRRRHRHPGLIALGVLVVAVVVLVAVWDWDWFIPIVRRVASAQLGRPVTIGHLHVRIARNPVIEVDDLRIGNPDGFTSVAPLADVGKLAVTLDAPAYLQRRALVVPGIELAHAQVNATQLADGRNNWTIGGSPSPDIGKSPAPGPQIGDLRISDSRVHAVLPKLKADFVLNVATRDDGGPQGAPQLLVDADGRYASQPVTGHFVGGALLSLRDANHPYPVDLRLRNGPTNVALTGTVQDPLEFRGADLKLQFAGPDLALLTPLTGVPLPESPAFRLTGQLDYADRRIRFRDFQGEVGRSDLEGTIAVDPSAEPRPRLEADLHSRRVDLADLGGFIGATPGDTHPRTETAAQKVEVARAERSSKLLPDTPLNLPKLQFADVDLTYRGTRIEGRSMPLDNVAADMTIKDGAVSLHPLSFGVGKGQIASRIALDPQDQGRVHARLDVDFRQVDVARLLAATHTFGGAGTIGGHADVDGTGKSVAQILGTGDGALKLFMTGGDLSALLVDLSGLEFGNSLLSALGIPKRTQVRCLVTDFVLRRGVVDTRTFVIDTTEANVNGKGTVNLNSEAIDLTLSTESKQVSIGSLPGPIVIGGDLKSPGIRPGAETAVRAGLAVGLGAVLTPLAALLPTITLGLGEDNNCGALIRSASRAPDPAQTKAERSR